MDYAKIYFQIFCEKAPFMLFQKANIWKKQLLNETPPVQTTGRKSGILTVSVTCEQ
jgi:hypothetical protein